jgi:hypothetical protein
MGFGRDGQVSHQTGERQFTRCCSIAGIAPTRHVAALVLIHGDQDPAAVLVGRTTGSVVGNGPEMAARTRRRALPGQRAYHRRVSLPPRLPHAMEHLLIDPWPVDRRSVANTFVAVSLLLLDMDNRTREPAIQTTAKRPCQKR